MKSVILNFRRTDRTNSMIKKLIDQAVEQLLNGKLDDSEMVSYGAFDRSISSLCLLNLNTTKMC